MINKFIAEKNKYAIRKFSVGVCSVYLGLTLAAYSVQADETAVRSEAPSVALSVEQESGTEQSAVLPENHSSTEEVSVEQATVPTLETGQSSAAMPQEALSAPSETAKTAPTLAVSVAEATTATTSELPQTLPEGEETEKPATKLVNVAKGKIPTINSNTLIEYELSTIPSVQIQNPKAATDGSKGNSSSDSNNTKIIAGKEIGGDDNGYSTWSPVYLQYDFGSVVPVESIAIYRNTYDNAISTFKNVKVDLSTSADFTTGTQTVFAEADIIETEETKGQAQSIVLNVPIDARYIRIWGRGHYIQNTNSSWEGYSNGVLINELEVMARVEDTGKQNENEKLVNLAALKEPYVYGLEPTNLKAINDGKFDDNYAYHNSRGWAYLQYEFKRSYNIKEIKFKLEPGVYTGIYVDLDNTPSPNDDYNPIYTNENVTIDQDSLITIPLDNIQSQYVRFSATRADNKPVGYSEIEILGTGDSYDEGRPDYVEPESKFKKLVWADEFDGDTVDESKWQIIDGMVNHAAIYNRGAVTIKKEGNHSYLSIRSKNFSSTKDLIDAVGVDPYDDKELASKITWSSGRVESKDKYSFQYGRIAVRAKVNDSQGIWPAIWMLAQDETGHDEIDVLEFLGQTPWEVWTTNHFGILAKNKSSDGVATEHYEAWSQAFHVYEVEWTSEEIKWYIDGEYVYSSIRGRDDGRDGMHSRPMFPILETQVGDGWVGDVDYTQNSTKQDSEYLIDWIRVYQEDKQNQAYFDNLDHTTSTSDYYIQPTTQLGQLVEVSDGKEPYENKNNFYYGGQPRYETSRLFAANDEQENALIYRIDNPSAVHLTTYYRTLSDYKVYNATAGADEGQSIRSHLIGDNSIDFKILVSTDGKDWTEADVSVVDNFIESTPAYARTTFDAKNLAAGTRFVKIVFPKVTGRQYRLLDQSLQDIQISDVQLAKVTFTAPEQVKSAKGADTKEDDKPIYLYYTLTEYDVDTKEVLTPTTPYLDRASIKSIGLKGYVYQEGKDEETVNTDDTARIDIVRYYSRLRTDVIKDGVTEAVSSEKNFVVAPVELKAKNQEMVNFKESQIVSSNRLPKTGQRDSRMLLSLGLSIILLAFRFLGKKTNED